uniref:Methionine--tRNA ligase, cytoplasmic n=1 Tax=Anisakis simplex TaxID=6269 RepID=A0A0M3IYI7_ANISI
LISIFSCEHKPSGCTLPVEGEKNILITSALPYVNNVPHLGNIIGCVLSADTFSRFCELKGWRHLFICGTDEYGTATEMKALQEGLTPKQICDKYFEIHKSIYEWFNIKFDRFGRTTNPHQIELTQDIFMKLYANGFISSGSVDQLHCDECDRYLADRYVHGECPYCHYEDARGDQCDACSKLINAVELIKPRCYICDQTPTIKRSTHLFIQLDELSKAVDEHINNQLKESACHWSSNAESIAKSWIKLGLEKRCISRDLKWGVPVPLEEFKDKVFYVWFDAPVGYMSITKELLGDAWTSWWKNPKNVELYNFVGKDNVAFHAFMFPASQLGARDGYTVVNHLCATEYLNYEGTKFSKSRGVGVFGDMARDTGIEADIWRFYLLYLRPETQDTSFAWDDFALKVNSELLGNLGNFVNRALSFVASSFNGVIPEMELEEAELELLEEVAKHLADYDTLLSHIKLRDGISKILQISRRGNQYIQAMQPWVLVKGDAQQKKRAGTVMGVAANISYLLSILLYPYMPQTSDRIRQQCALPDLPMLTLDPISYLKIGHRIGKPEPLFAKMEKSLVEEFKRKFGGGGTESDTKRSAHKENNEKKKKKSTKVIEKDSNIANIKVNAKMSAKYPGHCAIDRIVLETVLWFSFTGAKSGDDSVDIGRLDLRVGRILEASRHPDADALYVEKVDLGEAQPRTVVSGLVRHMVDDGWLVDHNNLIDAMVMCASTPEKVEILDVDPSSQPGQTVTCPPFESRPDALLNPKKKVWETVAVDLTVATNGQASYKGHPLLVNGKTPVTAATLRNVPVK